VLFLAIISHFHWFNHTFDAKKENKDYAAFLFKETNVSSVSFLRNMVEEATSLSFIREVLGSNSTRDASHPEYHFHIFCIIQINKWTTYIY